MTFWVLPKYFKKHSIALGVYILLQLSIFLLSFSYDYYTPAWYSSYKDMIQGIEMDQILHRLGGIYIAIFSVILGLLYTKMYWIGILNMGVVMLFFVFYGRWIAECATADHILCVVFQYVWIGIVIFTMRQFLMDYVLPRSINPQAEYNISKGRRLFEIYVVLFFITLPIVFINYVINLDYLLPLICDVTTHFVYTNIV